MQPINPIIGVLCVVAALTGQAFAGPLVDKATQAEEALRAGDIRGTLARLDEAMNLAWDVGPLFIKNALYVDAVSGFAQFTERAKGSAFRPDEKFVIYVEPAGYGFAQPVIGQFEFGFDVDIRLVTKSGEDVASKQDLIKTNQSARGRVKEFYLKLTLNIPGLKPGDYDLYVRLRDQNSEKYAVFDMPLTIVE